MSGITLMMLGNFALASGATPSSLYVWGGNYEGSSARNLNGTAGESSSPIQLGSETDWLQFSGSYNFVGTRSSGHLYNCGDNRFGAWNNGALHTSSPIQIGSLTNWAGGYLEQKGVGCHIIKKDGSLWGWGDNDYGGVGVNTGSGYSKYSSPVQIGSLTTWAVVTGGGFSAVQAVKTDGSLWMWGIAGNGGLGNGTVTGNISSPVQLGSLTNWSKVASGAENHQLHIKTDGTLWSWGNNNYGQLGLNDTSNRNSPVQVGSSTGWTDISAGYQQSGGVDAGKLYMWGRNNNGEVGDNTKNQRNAPVQIGSLTTWENVAVGNAMVLAKKTDGTIWGWGANWQGQAGQSTTYSTVKYSSPVQIGSQTNWTAIHLGTSGSATAMGGRA